MNEKYAKKIRRELRRVNHEVVMQFYHAIAQQPFRRKFKIAFKVLLSKYDKRLKGNE